MNWLLLFIPIAIALDRWHVTPLAVFLASAVALVPLAKLMEQSTEALARDLGPIYGGLLNATMGNAPEFIIGISALRHGLVEVLKGAIAGSIIGTLLFGVGVTVIAGSWRKPAQFDRRMVAINGGLLMLGAFGLVIPASFHFNAHTDRNISVEISLILLAVYVAGMFQTLMANKPSGGKGPSREELAEKGKAPLACVSAAPLPPWSRSKALLVLAVVAVAIAIVSDLLTGSLQDAAQGLGLTPAFAGVFMLATVANIPDYTNAVTFAARNQMTLALSINLGATTQLIVLIAPLLVIAGTLMGTDMNLHFSAFEVIAVILSVIVVRSVIADACSTWLEGVMLIAVYLMLGVGFYNMPANAG
jgi:Ca2+:H+ antiporter